MSRSDPRLADDAYMREMYQHTAEELREMMMRGEDVTEFYDGDPMELL